MLHSETAASSVRLCIVSNFHFGVRIFVALDAIVKRRERHFQILIMPIAILFVFRSLR